MQTKVVVEFCELPIQQCAFSFLFRFQTNTIHFSEWIGGTIAHPRDTAGGLTIERIIEDEICKRVSIFTDDELVLETKALPLEAVRIDEKYTVAIINQGAHVVLLRGGEYWTTPREGKAWIAVAAALHNAGVSRYVWMPPK